MIEIVIPGKKNSLKHLNGFCTHKYPNGSVTRTTKINNLIVSINDKNIIRVRGSLTKFYYGNNIETLYSDEIIPAISKLEDYLNLSLDEAEVESIEWGRCFFMNEEVKLYINELGDAKGYKDAGRYNNSIQYLKSYQKLKIYDKLSEMKYKKEPIPECFQDENILRIEIAFLRKVSKILGLNKFTLSMLKDSHIQEILLDFWFGEFHKIVPKSNFRFREGFEPKNPTELKRAAMLLGIQSFGGINHFYQELDRIKNKRIYNGEFSNGDRTRHNRMRQEIKKILKSQDYFEKSSLINELDNKMIRALNEFWYSGKS